MAGSITVTTSDLGGGMTKYAIAWLSTAGGAVSANAVAVKRGRLHRVKFVPGAGGVQPTDAYDVTVTDADSVDVLHGLGANLSNATAKIVPQLDGSGGTPNTLGFLEGGDLTPVIANAGNAKTGTIELIVGP